MRLLVIGGYGGFGRHISRRLAAAGHDVVVAGRSLAPAAEFCGDDRRLSPMALDRTNTREVAGALERLRPFALIDAAGPFQGASYELARCCIMAGCHYVDIADGRDFVEQVSGLDEAAKAAGVSVVVGASTVPALSGAVVRALCDGMEDVRAVEIAISGSNRATLGSSVSRAILSYVGKPVRLWSGSVATVGFGWQGLRWIRLATEGMRLPARLVALADVPDLALLPERLPGRPAVTFRAGTELALPNLILWLLSWTVRWGWWTNLVPITPGLLLFLRLMSKIGTDRSGMMVRVLGSVGGQRRARSWTLIADQGDGPQVPTLAAPLIIEELARGRLPAGAYDAGPLLVLAKFDPAFASLSIRQAMTDGSHPPPLYARIMGERFDGLPGSVRTMHEFFHSGSASGRASVQRGTSAAARFVARMFGFPSAGEHELRVIFKEHAGGEVWTRFFSGRGFSSRMSCLGGQLVESFGPLRFAFDLPSDRKGLAMVMTRWWFGPCPLPLAWAPRSAAREWDDEGTFAFDVPVSLPVTGLLVHYRGWLRPDRVDPARPSTSTP